MGRARITQKRRGAVTVRCRASASVSLDTEQLYWLASASPASPPSKPPSPTAGPQRVFAASRMLLHFLPLVDRFLHSAASVSTKPSQTPPVSAADSMQLSRSPCVVHASHAASRHHSRNWTALPQVSFSTTPKQAPKL